MRFNVTFSEDVNSFTPVFSEEPSFDTSFGAVTLIPVADQAVLYIPQVLSPEQKAQARTNIDAPNGESIGDLEELHTEDKSSLVAAINELLSTPSISSWDQLEGKPFDAIGGNLKVENGILSVDTAPNVEQDNTKPITSAAVYTEVGNINALLSLI